MNEYGLREGEFEWSEAEKGGDLSLWCSASERRSLLQVEDGWLVIVVNSGWLRRAWRAVPPACFGVVGQGQSIGRVGTQCSC